MSGETEQNVSGWTTDTLHEFITEMMEERDKRYEQRFAAQEEAIRRTDKDTEKRFDSVNEFRAQLRDQAATFLPRSEYAPAHSALSDRLVALTDRFNTWQGTERGGVESRTIQRSDSSFNVALIGLIASVAISLILLILRLTGH